MGACAKKGCTNNTNKNPKTGRDHKYCKSCSIYLKNNKTYRNKTKTKKESEPKLFVLKGNRLRINFSHTTKIITVDRECRAVMFNEERQANNGETMKYVLQIKKGSNILVSILSDNKKDRDKQFRKLQKILNTL